MTDYAKFTVVKLKEELDARGLPKTGLKAVLVQRLQDADAENASKETQPDANVEINPKSNVDAKTDADANIETSADLATSASAPETNAPQVPEISSNIPADGSAVQTVHEEIPSRPDQPIVQPDDAGHPRPVQSTLDQPEPETIQARPEDLAEAEQVSETVTQPDTKGSDTTDKIINAARQEPDIVPSNVEQEQASLSEDVQDPSDTVLPAHDDSELAPALPKELMEEVVPTTEAVNTTIPGQDGSLHASSAKLDGADISIQAEDKTNPMESASEQANKSSPAVDLNEAVDARNPISRSMTIPSVSGEEMAEDSRKRKQRSQSPAPSSASLTTSKRPRAADAPIDRESAPESLPEPIVADGDLATPSQPVENTGGESITEEDHASSAKDEETHTSKSVMSDRRFKTLAEPSAPSPGFENLPSNVKVTDDMNTRGIAPALHPATSALYIANLMRPINIPSFKAHLDAIASTGSRDIEMNGGDKPEPPGDTTSTSSIEQLHLDPVRTHAFVKFTSSTAAARVRSQLHDCVWPPERDRKALWIDFIPEDSLDEWIARESSRQSTSGAASGPTSRAAGARRWEVAYSTNPDTGAVTASLQEAGSHTTFTGAPTATIASSVHAGIRSPPNSSSGPPTENHQASDSRTSLDARPVNDQNHGRLAESSEFKALDDLFSCTTTKPKLYYLPCSSDTVEARMALLDRGRGGGRSDELCRFTFEDGGIVDRGPDFGMDKQRPGHDRYQDRFSRRGAGGRGPRMHYGRQYQQRYDDRGPSALDQRYQYRGSGLGYNR